MKSTFACLALLVTASGVYAEPAPSVGDFQVIITQEAGRTVGINIVQAHGDNVMFFSNISPDDVQWQDELGSLRTGIYTGDIDSVELGVCSGVNCSVGIGSRFMSSVGVGLQD